MRQIWIGRIVGSLVALACVGTATAQPQADVARQLRVEWEALDEAWSRPRLAGHVYNDSTYRIGSVRLRVEVLDAGGKVVREELAWIYVDVPAHSRASFSLRRPKGQAFRLGVESFVLIAREGGEQTP